MTKVLTPHRPNRVPQIVLLYWVIKIAATTLGETGADAASMTYDLGYATTIGIFLVLFLALLALKLALKRYEPVTYWATFTASAIAGTAVSDFIDRTLGLGYAAGAGILVLLLLGVLGVWYAVERSLSVERITTAPAELFYWAAFLIANTLGTAAGDWVADDLGAGFVAAAGVFTALLVVTAALHYLTRVPGVILFWIAFVLTRPFGATFGDFLTKTHEQGGLDLGTVGASAAFGLVLAAALAWEVLLRRRHAAATADAPPASRP